MFSFFLQLRKFFYDKQKSSTETEILPTAPLIDY